MYLTEEEKQKLKENCEAIRDYLKGLVENVPTDIRIAVDFNRRRDGHSMGISVSKYNKKIEVYGFSGGLSIVFEESERESGRSLAWGFQDYAIELIQQWQSIKNMFHCKLEQETRERQGIMNFQL